MSRVQESEKSATRRAQQQNVKGFPLLTAAGYFLREILLHAHIDSIGAVWYNMRMNEDTQNPQAASAQNGQSVAPEVGLKKGDSKKPKRRIIRSLTGVTMLRYIVFAGVVLIMLWMAFFIGMYWFYDDVIKAEVRDVGKSVSEVLPEQFAYSPDMHLKYRLSDIARSNSVAIIIFSRVDGVNTVQMTIDPLGYGHTDGSDFFDAVATELDTKIGFDNYKSPVTVSTEYGNYAGYFDEIGVWDEDGVSTEYCYVVLKSYEHFNDQTSKVLLVLVVSTIIVLAVSVGLAFLASRSQVKKLREFSQQAKHIADGDYNVKFSGNGYNEFESLASALNAATESMHKAESMQRDVVANVSHDIRTPLTMIRASAEMLRDMPLEAGKREKTANVIISEADRLTLLTDDILSFSRLQSGVTEMKFEECDISEIATMTLGRFGILRERDGVIFRSDIDKKLIVTCDKQRIEQVLYNLIINAVNYRGNDNVVELCVKSTENRVRVEVTDHGDGIPQDEIADIWDKYYRAAHSKRSKVGSGLGLSICKNILTSHGAPFGVFSEVGKGSTFWFELELCGKTHA